MPYSSKAVTKKSVGVYRCVKEDPGGYGMVEIDCDPDFDLDYTTVSFVFFMSFVVKQELLNYQDQEVHEEGEAECLDRICGTLHQVTDWIRRQDRIPPFFQRKS